jgi:NTP pyrophosphatase (non-canonical NTP hydrolase)
MIVELDYGVKDFCEKVPQTTERWARAVAEEAGEVVGAFNKLTDRRVDKLKRKVDVENEIAQTIACALALAHEMGFSPVIVLNDTIEFMKAKIDRTGDAHYEVER